MFSDLPGRKLWYSAMDEAKMRTSEFSSTRIFFVPLPCQLKRF